MPPDRFVFLIVSYTTINILGLVVGKINELGKLIPGMIAFMASSLTAGRSNTAAPAAQGTLIVGHSFSFAEVYHH